MNENNDSKKPKLDLGSGDDEDCHDSDVDFKFSNELALEKIRQLQAKFCKERNWDQFHKPRNVLLALVGEVGELAEIFQWKGEVSVGIPELSTKEKEHVGEELSDILINLVRLADRCQIDLPSAVLQKLHQNGLKYPIQKAYGKCKKYTDYVTEGKGDDERT
ncbi:dCTP pyrophosphatase 1-like isoform X2 [Saccostrea cucullata]|uniref:dCTP pyrophosphatase 1-like isoform X2 n=1 Tax=Saccostrea cuccullata TaxID=36930 RepID=UPI002ED00C3C